MKRPLCLLGFVAVLLVGAGSTMGCNDELAALPSDAPSTWLRIARDASAVLFLTGLVGSLGVALSPSWEVSR